MTMAPETVVRAAEPAVADIVAARVVGATTVAVEFADGRSGTFDVAPFLAYPAFVRLANPVYFQGFAVAFGTICWPAGEDFAPETVAARLVRIG